MTEHTLNWSDLYSFGDLFSDEKLTRDLDSPGVYLWIDPLGDVANEIVYVGRTRTSLKARLWQHYLYQTCGCYDVPTHPIDSTGYWQPGRPTPTVCHIMSDREKFMKVAAAAWDYANLRLKVSVAKISRDLVTADGRPLVDAVERQLLWDLKPKFTKPGTRKAPEQQFEITHKNALLTMHTLSSGAQRSSITQAG